MNKEKVDNLYQDFKITLSEEEWEYFYNKMKHEVLLVTNQQPTQIKDVATLNATYPPTENPTVEYDRLYLIEENDSEHSDSKGFLYHYNKNTNKWTKGSLYEDSAAIDELRESKIDYKMLDWGTMPTNITDKKTFYHEVSKVFVNHPTQAIYMYGDQMQLTRFFEIWGKPKGLVATHVIISVRPISNVSSRVSFKIYLTSSNDRDGDIYMLSASGFSGTFLGDTGWVNLKRSEESVTATPNTVMVRQSDGAAFANTHLENPDDMELTNAKYVRQEIDKVKIDAFDLSNIIVNPYKGLVIDITEDGKHLEIHLDKDYPFIELTVKRYSPDKHMVTLDDKEVQLLKGLRVDVELQYEGVFMTQTHLIWLPTAPTQAVVHLGYVLPNPQVFSDTIIAQYNDNTSEVTVQTTGSAIPTIIKIFDVKGII